MYLNMNLKSACGSCTLTISVYVDMNLKRVLWFMYLNNRVYDASLRVHSCPLDFLGPRGLFRAQPPGGGTIICTKGCLNPKP